MMNKTAKIWLTVAALLILLGAILFIAAMSAGGWDLNKLGTVTYTTNTYEPGGDFQNISIDVETTEIELVPSDDGTCRVVCFEDEKLRHSVSVQNGTLTVKTVDTRKWYEHISVSFVSPKLTVYLPQTAYGYLAVKTDTGDITLEEVTAGQMELHTDTGRIRVRRAAVGESIRIETDTGRVTLEDTSCKNLDAKTDTGSITLTNVVASGKFKIESDTGDVALNDSDAMEISVKTDTGDVTGRLLSDKIFLAESDTGRVSVPKSTTGGKCEIKTATGDIRVEIRA